MSIKGTISVFKLVSKRNFGGHIFGKKAVQSCGRLGNCSRMSQFHWIPVPTRTDTSQNISLQFTDTQPGGFKVGQVSKILAGVQSSEKMVGEINQLCSRKPYIGILFDNFDGDVIANWGKEGAGNTWEAYVKGFGNLYCDSEKGATKCKGRLLGDRILFIGMLRADDLQKEALGFAMKKRDIEVNKQLASLVSEHSARLMRMVNDITRTKLDCLFVLSGGDNAIYACVKAVKSEESEVILIRLDRHMDERDLSLRSDPRVNSNIYSHSGNGITQAKAEQLVNYDFLLACDYERNNDQCIRNSQKYSQTNFSSITTIEEMRIDPKWHIDSVIEQVEAIMKDKSRAELIVNIDCDTFNGIPASAETYTGGLDPVWAFYLLDRLSTLPRPPRVIRVAELQYSGAEWRRQVAEDFAAEILRSGAKAIQKFSKI